MYENDSPTVTTHKTKLENKLSIDTDRTSTVKVSGQIITVIGHVLITFTHFSRRSMTVYISTGVLEHLRAAIILGFAQILITHEHFRISTYNLLLAGKYRLFLSVNFSVLSAN